MKNIISAMVISALLVLSSCAVTQNKFSTSFEVIKIPKLYTGKWVKVKFRGNNESLSRCIYSKGVVKENKKTLVMSQVGHKYAFQIFRKRNGVKFNEDLEFLHSYTILTIAENAYTKGENILIITFDDGISEIDEILSKKFKTEIPIGTIIKKMDEHQIKKSKS